MGGGGGVLARAHEDAAFAKTVWITDKIIISNTAQSLKGFYAKYYTEMTIPALVESAASSFFSSQSGGN